MAKAIGHFGKEKGINLKISVIIVTLNSGKRLKDTVESTISQTYNNVEILIKDGGSKDGSLDFLREKQNVRVVTKKDNSIYDAMNQAVELATGDYYIFMNAGDVFADKKVLALVAKHIINNGSDIVYGDMLRKGSDTLIPYPEKLTDFGCYRNVPCHQVCFYKRVLFEKRGYNLKYSIRADYEHFLWCVYGFKGKTSHIDIPICVYEGGGYSETKENQKKSAEEHKEITEKYLGKKCVLYKTAMIVTLQPVRKKIAESKGLSGAYQAMKKVVYKR